MSDVSGLNLGVREPTFSAKPRSAQAARTVEAPERFRDALERKAAEPSSKRAAREAAESFVATALVKPVLAQMREMNDAAPPFGPGPWEKQFAGLMDEALSERIVRARNFPLVDRIASDLERAGSSMTEVTA